MTVDLKAERLRRGLSLDQLAEAIEVPKTTLARMESGTTPRPEVRKKVAEFYGFDLFDQWPLETKATV
jgi:transcriptional regulator with XRE-family HTH domain